MVSESRERQRQGRAGIRWGAAGVWMFIVVGFIVPGVWGAIRGFPVPVPWSNYTWGHWIVLWLGASTVTAALAVALSRLLSRAGREQ